MAFIDEPTAARLASATVRPSMLLLVKTWSGGWLRLWGGFGDFPVAADGIDTDGGVYLGLGELVETPALSQLINGLAERLTARLSGVDATSLALAEEDAPSVHEAAAHIGVVFFEADWSVLTPPLWLWEGVADSLGISRTDGVRTVSLSLGSADRARSRPGLSYFTRAHQRRRSADDAFCDRVALYGAGSTVRWPT